MNARPGYSDFKNGRSFCETVTVAWQLRDVPAGGGGFACVPTPNNISEMPATNSSAVSKISTSVYSDIGWSRYQARTRHSELAVASIRPTTLDWLTH